MSAKIFSIFLFLALSLPSTFTQEEDSFIYGTFPNDFEFGFATASYQIEGGWNLGGKGENIWDNWTHLEPSPIDDASSGDIACDSYNNWEQDVQILVDMGAKAYRFSVAWSRILPNGINDTINPLGIQYYNNLIDKLLANGIEPMITLYHWDLPQPLMRPDGWPEEIIVQDFVNFADVAFRSFGDRVKKWITFNEPWVVCYQGYQTLDKAPAINKGPELVYQCAHNIIKSHAKAYRLYEQQYKPTQNGLVGITLDCSWLEPKDPNNALHVEASERGLAFKHGWFAGPIYHGDYPQVMKDYILNATIEEGLTSTRLPEFTAMEKLEIMGSSDFIGLNHYTTNLAEPNVDPTPGWGGDQDVKTTMDDSWPYSSALWLRVVPWGFRKLLKWIKDTYDNPTIYVTENGFADYASSNTADVQRTRYYESYINEMLKAILIDEVNVTSYTAWSLMDNFEWRRGYTQRFGVHYVDFNDPERKRVPKDSALRLKQIFADNGFPNPNPTPTSTSATASTVVDDENTTKANSNKIQFNFVIAFVMILVAKIF